MTTTWIVIAVLVWISAAANIVAGYLAWRNYRRVRRITKGMI